MSDREIARALKIGRPAVAKYWEAFTRSNLTYDQIREMSDVQFLEIMEGPKKKVAERLQVLIGYFPEIVRELKKTGVTLELLWNEYKQKHPDGYQYSQFCYHFEIWRKSCDIYMHIDHKPGEEMYVDYTGDKLIIVEPETGARKAVEVFVAILGASGLTYAEGSLSQNKEDWMKSNERALWYFGGVPRAIVPDNLKSAVTKSDAYEPGINAQFDDFAEYYGTVILPARARKPRDKALVENAVRIVYRRIFAPLRNRTFYSLDDLNQAVFELLEVHNNRKYQKLPYSRREFFEQTERESLKSLPACKYPHKTFQHATVQFNYHVWLKEDRNYYSVPYLLKQKNRDCDVLIMYDDRTVTISYENVRVARHVRNRTMNHYTTDPDHMPPHHRFSRDWSPERFLNWANGIGPDVAGVIERILKTVKHPEQAYKRCLGLLNATKKVGSAVLDRACRRANEYGICSLNRILSMASQLIEEDAQPELSWNTGIPEHDNIRGSGYYSQYEGGNN